MLRFVFPLLIAAIAWSEMEWSVTQGFLSISFTTSAIYLFVSQQSHSLTEEQKKKNSQEFIIFKFTSFQYFTDFFKFSLR